MKTNIKSIIILIILSGNLCFAQLTQIKAPNMYSEVPVYKNQNDELYTTLIRFKYSKLLVDIPKGQTSFRDDNILYPTFKNILNKIRTQYGPCTITKSIPESLWGDTLRMNKRTKKQVVIPDFSQIYNMIFEKLVPIDSVKNILLKEENVQYAEGPFIAYTTLSPNDTYYLDNNYRWSFDVINAEKAWDITKGSSDIKVGINDRFDVDNVPLHQELTGKVVWDDLNGKYGDHGTQVAGVVGAITNNGEGIASLGWNTSVMLASWTVAGINSLISHGADVINFSWITNDSHTYSSAILSALQQGIVCVASAGNSESQVPVVRYPASHNFGTDGQVIAVSASQLVSGTERFLDNFNYSPGTDPINDPTNAFIDFSAPGANVRGLSRFDNINTEHIWVGTSVSSPFVSALVALIYSINYFLTPNQIYNILKESTDKIDQSRHPDNSNGWNQWTGYGRINAYKALKYTLENYGGALTQDLTIHTGEVWNFQPGITITFANGKSLIVNGTLNAVGNSTNGITFNRSGSSGTWGGIQFNSGSTGSLDYCTITNASTGIYCYNSSPTIKHSTLDYNGTGLGCNQYSSPILVGNNFRFNSSHGISCNTYSSPNLTDNGYPGSNVIRNNLTGIYAVYSSNPTLTGYMTYGNSIFDNTYHNIQANYNCNINAQRVFWNGNTKISTYQSTVDASNPLTTNPNPNRSIIEKGERGNIIASYETNPSDIPTDDLSQALEMERQKRYDEAIVLFLEVFKKNKEELVGKYALTKIEECFTQSGRKDYLSFSDKEIKPNITVGNETYVIALELEAHQMINAEEYSGAINNLTTILTKYNLNKNIEKNTLFTLGSYYTLFSNNKTDADNYYNTLKTKYPEDDLTAQIEIIKRMGESNSENRKIVLPNPEIKSEPKTNNEEISISNYPNPFNPTTTIEYNLPTEGNVKLEVYNSLGQLVNVLIEGNQRAGRQRVTWSGKDSFGSSVSSGIYFYRIKTNSFTQVKKMILMK